MSFLEQNGFGDYAFNECYAMNEVYSYVSDLSEFWMGYNVFSHWDQDVYAAKGKNMLAK